MRVSSFGRFLIVALLSIFSFPVVFASSPLLLVQAGEGAGSGSSSGETSEGTFSNNSKWRDLDSRRLAKIVSALSSGSLVRIRVSGQGDIVGHITQKSDSSFTLTGKSRKIIVAAESIDALWVQETANGTGALIGGIVGLALGIGVGLNAKSVCEKNVGYAPGGDCGGATVAYTIALTIGGALAGASIGQTMTSWRLSYSSFGYDYLSMRWPDQIRSGGTTGKAGGLRLAISIPF